MGDATKEARCEYSEYVGVQFGSHILLGMRPRFPGALERATGIEPV